MQKLRISLPLVVLVLTMGVARVEAEVPRLKIEHKSPILSVVWSPDGSWIATGCQDGTVHIFEVNSGKEIGWVSTGEPVWALTVSSNAKSLFIATPDLRHLRRWEFGNDGLSAPMVIGNPNDEFLLKQGLFVVAADACVVLDQGNCFVFSCRTDDFGKGWQLNKVMADITAISPDGLFGGSLDSDGVVHIQIKKGASLATPAKVEVGKGHSLAFVPRRNLIAVGSASQIHLWHSDSKAKLASLTGLDRPAGKLLSSRDGDTLIALTADKRRIVTWDLKTMKLRSQIKHREGKVHILAVAPDGKTIATATEYSKTLYLWDATTLRTLNRKDQESALLVEQAATHWNDLANSDGKKADVAWQCLGAGGDTVIPFLRQKLLSLAVPASDQKLIAKLVVDLGSEIFATREEAVKDLVAAGEIAILPLQRMLDKPLSPEAAWRAKAVLQRIGEPELAPDRIRVLEAIDLLEQLGTAKAVELLRKIERDALIAQIQQEASGALKRIAAAKSEKD